jgi:phosphatidylglycerol:prolipoprotein diacylglycerol transferase
MALAWIKKKKDNIFVITRYLIYYSALRFVVEYFRGDKIRGLHALDFSTSQIIALAMFSGAIAVVIFQKFSRQSSF